MTKKFLITRFPYEAVFSGEEIHTLQLSEKLRENNHQISFAGSCPVLLPEFAKRNFQSSKFWGGKALVSTKSFWIFVFTFPFVILSFLQLAYIAKFKWKIDCVYMLSLNEKLFLTPWLKLFKLKAIWVEHSRVGDWLIKNPFLFLYKKLSKSVQVISVSKKTQKQLIDLEIEEKQVHFILNGVDLETLQKTSKIGIQKWQKQNLQSEFFPKIKPEMEKKIGLITRLYPDKGIDYFLGALPKLIEKHPEIEVFVVGEGPYAKEYQYFAKGLPVKFLGKLEHSEIKYFLNSIDYFILPSSAHDPFGLAPAEAMACGKPVIVTDVCGISEFMQNEKDGLIIPARNSNAIATAFEKLFNDEKLTNNLAKSGYKLAKEKFSLDRMTEEYIKLLNSFIL